MGGAFFRFHFSVPLGSFSLPSCRHGSSLVQRKTCAFLVVQLESRHSWAQGTRFFAFDVNLRKMNSCTSALAILPPVVTSAFSNTIPGPRFD